MDIRTLTEDLDTAVAQGKAIIEGAQKDKKPLSAEAKAKLDQILGHTVELKAQIDEVEAIEEKAADLAKLESWMSAPKYKTPRPGTDRVGNGESETKVALSNFGWEIKSGMVLAPTSLGKMVPYCPEEVLLGAYPEDDRARDFYMRQRTIFQPEYRKTFLKYVQMCIKCRSETMALSQMDPIEQKALSEGTDIAGGLLVPPDVQAEVLVRVPMKSIMRQLARVVMTSRDLLAFPLITPNTSSNGNGSIYTSGFVGDWASETPVFNDINPGIGAFNIAVRKARCATKISNDLVADSVFPFLSFLASDGSTNMALVEDNGFIAGQTSYFLNGANVSTAAVSLQPLGLLQAVVTANSVDVTGSTSHKISNTTSNLGSMPKIPAVQANLPQQYQANAKWLMHRLTELEVRQLTDFEGRFVFAPGYMSPTGTAGEQFNSLYGKEVVRSDFMAQDGAANNPCMVYGDFSNYIIAQRAGISVTILRERFADTDQTGIILWERVGGATWNTDAFRFGTVT